MQDIKDLLSSFKEVLLGEENRKEKIISIIESITKIKIKSTDFEIKNSIIFLNIKPVFKNEIFLKKELILKEIKNSFSKRVPIDII